MDAIRPVSTLGAVLALTASFSVARAQWTVTYLHPAGASYSQAFAATGAQQVGEQWIGIWPHAGVWSGSAASWVVLHPPGALVSHVYATSGTQQAGRADIAGVSRAGIWTGSAASWVDLHRFAPKAFVATYAHGIWRDERYIYVVGVGSNSATQRQEALMWRRRRT